MEVDTVTHFDSIESAQEYLVLLSEVVAESQQTLHEDIESRGADGARHVEALRIAAMKLDNLERHLKSSCRILNDLRMLRRVLHRAA